MVTRSTSRAMFQVLEEILAGLKNGDIAVSVFMDLSKTSDDTRIVTRAKHSSDLAVTLESNFTELQKLCEYHSLKQNLQKTKFHARLG